MNNLCHKIKELRIKNNMSQFDLGEKLYVSDKTISSWESKGYCAYTYKYTARIYSRNQKIRLASDFEKNNIVLNPHNTGNNRNG